MADLVNLHFSNNAHSGSPRLGHYCKKTKLVSRHGGLEGCRWWSDYKNSLQFGRVDLAWIRIKV